MCGRYASTTSRANLLEQFQVDDDNAAELKGPDYNFAPTKVAPVVIARAPVDGPMPTRCGSCGCSSGGFYRINCTRQPW